MLTVKPMSLADANRFVAEHHRHHKPVRGHKFSLGCMANGHLAGVSLRASGWQCAGLAGGREWTGRRRPPEPLYPAQMKYRYEKALR